MNKVILLIAGLICSIEVNASCYGNILKEDAPVPDVLNLILVDETTPILDSVQGGFEKVVDKVARHYGNRIVVVPFSSLTSQKPPLVASDVYNEPPLTEEKLSETPIKKGNLMGPCVLKQTQKNAIQVKGIVHQALQQNADFGSYSEILFAIRSMLGSYSVGLNDNTRIRLIVYSDGYLNSLKGFSLYTKGKQRIPNDKDTTKILTAEKVEPVSKPFEVIWFGLGSVPSGYIAPSDIEKMKGFWTAVLQKLGASRTQMDLVLNNPIID